MKIKLIIIATLSLLLCGCEFKDKHSAYNLVDNESSVVNNVLALERNYSIEQDSVNEYNPSIKSLTVKPIDLEIQEINFCEQKGVRQTFQIVGYILYVAKILVPLILIIMGTIDFAKATISSDDKAPKEAVTMLIKRILIAVIIFLIPTILSFLLPLVNGATEAFTDSNFTDCTDCLLDPFGDCKADGINGMN